MVRTANKTAWQKRHERDAEKLRRHGTTDRVKRRKPDPGRTPDVREIPGFARQPITSAVPAMEDKGSVSGPTDTEWLETFFDRVYVVNLDRRPDRWDSFQKRVHASGWPFAAAQRFSATDGQQEPPPDWYRPGKGAWGCYRSHVRAMQDAINGGCERILILEDDAVPLDGFAENAARFLSNLPGDWDQAYLGGQLLWWQLSPPRKINEHVLRPHNVNRTHAYALSRSGMEKALAYMTDEDDYRATLERGFKHHVDHRYGWMHMHGLMNAYCPYRWCFGQAEGHSNIKGKSMGENEWQANTSKTVRDLPAVAVIGLYKGGSSCVAGILHHLGVFMGDNLKRVKLYPNYEDWSIRNLCVQQFPEPELEPQNDERLRVKALQEWAREHRRKAPDNCEMVGAKHPIMPLMIDEIARAWGHGTKFINVQRPLEDTIESLRKRNWRKFVTHKVSEKLDKARNEKIGNHDHMTVDYDALLADPRQWVQAIVDYLGLHPTAEQFEAAVQSVDPEMHNVKGGKVVTETPKRIPDKKESCTLRLIGGIGDQLWSRPFVRQALNDYEHVHVVTSWPKLWWDLVGQEGLRLIRRDGRTKLHQASAAENAEMYWADEQPKGGDVYQLRYHGGLTDGLTYIQAMERHYTLRDGVDMSFPIKPEWRAEARKLIDSLDVPEDKPLVIYRPASIKNVWRAPARNPDQQSYCDVVASLRKRGCHVVSLGYADGQYERLCEPLADVDAEIHQQTALTTMLAVLNECDLVLTAPGVGQVMALANTLPCLTVYGGFIPDSQIADPRLDTSNYTALHPPNAIFQNKPRQDAGDKTIPQQMVEDTVNKVIEKHGLIAGQREHA